MAHCCDPPSPDIQPTVDLPEWITEGFLMLLIMKCKRTNATKRLQMDHFDSDPEEMWMLGKTDDFEFFNHFNLIDPKNRKNHAVRVLFDDAKMYAVMDWGETLVADREKVEACFSALITNDWLVEGF